MIYLYVGSYAALIGLLQIELYTTQKNRTKSYRFIIHTFQLLKKQTPCAIITKFRLVSLLNITNKNNFKKLV